MWIAKNGAFYYIVIILKRGDIYYAKLNPVVGSEQGGKHRPVLIISNDKGNKHSTTVIVAAITGKEHAKPNLPTHVIVNDCECLEKDSIILFEQIRTLDKQRLSKVPMYSCRRCLSSVLICSSRMMESFSRHS